MYEIQNFFQLDIVIVCGLHGSGKSHFAHRFFREQNFKRVNRGELRKSLFMMTHYGEEWKNSNFKAENENLVKHVERKIIEQIILENKKILIDNTSLTKEYRKNYINIAKKNNKQIGAIFLHTPIDVCLERNRKQEDPFPESLISNQFANIDSPTESEGFKKVKIISDYN